MISKTTKSVALKGLLFGLVTSLGACGDKTTPVVKTPVPVNPVPAPSTANFANDPLVQYVIPQLQAMYGNVKIVYPGSASVNGVTFSGSMTWQQIYTNVTEIIRRLPSNCLGQAPTAGMTAWAYVNYGCLNQLSAADQNALSLTTVDFTNIYSGSSNFDSYLAVVVNMITGYGYQSTIGMYSQYTNAYTQYNPYFQQWAPVTGYGNYNGGAVTGGLSLGNGGFGLNLGGVFQF